MTCSTALSGVFLSMMLREDADRKKTGAAPASSNSVDGADEPWRKAKREMGIVESKRARKGEEASVKSKSVAWFLFRSWSVCKV
jgi:hypothetical protein